MTEDEQRKKNSGLTDQEVKTIDEWIDRLRHLNKFKIAEVMPKSNTVSVKPLPFWENPEAEKIKRLLLRKGIIERHSVAEHFVAGYYQLSDLGFSIFEAGGWLAFHRCRKDERSIPKTTPQPHIIQIIMRSMIKPVSWFIALMLPIIASAFIPETRVLLESLWTFIVSIFFNSVP